MNKKAIERILKNLLENDTYTIDKEESEILLNYIAGLQRKEYNNSKAIEYIETAKRNEENDNMKEYIYTKEDLLNILEKGE